MSGNGSGEGGLIGTFRAELMVDVGHPHVIPEPVETIEQAQAVSAPGDATDHPFAGAKKPVPIDEIGHASAEFHSTPDYSTRVRQSLLT